MGRTGDPRGTNVAALSKRLTFYESQRDSATKPRVARNELPWVQCAKNNNPNGIAATRLVFSGDETPLGFSLF